jgi:hypothetical protein
VEGDEMIPAEQGRRGDCATRSVLPGKKARRQRGRGEAMRMAPQQKKSREMLAGGRTGKGRLFFFMFRLKGYKNIEIFRRAVRDDFFDKFS